jgi:hypothetical protein
VGDPFLDFSLKRDFHWGSVFFLGKFSPVPYLILELATNTLGIFPKKLDEIAKSILEKY